MGPQADSSSTAIPMVPPPPAPSSTRARNVMRGNRSESAVERQLRSMLHRRGLRFRKHLAPLRGLRCRADIVFTRRRVAVFVDGCFWHRCPDHASDPKANGEWWALKLGANVARDARNNRELTQAGWKVLRLWEHEAPDDMLRKVLGVLDDAAHAEFEVSPIDDS